MTRHPARTETRVPCQTSPDSWFPEPGDNQTARIAKHLCVTRCPVQAACANYGVRHEQHGIYGGLSAGERATILSRRGIILQTPMVNTYREAS